MRWDLVIVGGGPGGAAAAITAKQADSSLRVLLIERSLFPRHCPGETLHPGIEPLLVQLGVWDQVLAADFLRHTGHWVAWNRPCEFQPFGMDEGGNLWQGFQAWRADFDQILLERARDAGVAVWQPCRALHPLVKKLDQAGQAVVGVVCERDGKLHEILAQYVVDAGGGTHWLARKLSLAIENYSPKLIVNYGYANGKLSTNHRLPLLMADERGWTWATHVKKDIYHWARLSLTNSHSEHRLPSALTGLTVQDKMYGADVTWRSVNHPAGPGYFISGDAGAVFDPTSSHGVLRAMMSGIYAGYLAVQVLREKAQAGQATQIYTQWIQQWIQHEVKNLHALYTMLPNPPDWVYKL